VITRADDLGGAQIHVRDLASALQDRGLEVGVFSGRGGVLSRQLEKLGVAFEQIPGLARALHPARDPLAVASLWRALRRFRPDLISTHCAKAGFLGRAVARLLGIPALFTAHGWSFADGVPAGRRALYRGLETLASPLSKRVIVVSDADRRVAIESRVVAQRRLRLVYNGMPDVPRQLQARPELAPIRLATVARLCEQKDYPTLFRALRTLRDLDWQLDVIGNGPLHDATLALAEELGLGDRIRFLGMREDVAELLARAQLYLLISNWEGFPRGILEAMRAGLPVVASDVGGVRESVTDGATGFVVPRADAGHLATRIRQLLQEPSLRLAMGQAGRARYEQRFTFERMLDETLAVYREVLA
jgi:glycosyltransferase involved in cell wall biosynthesis